MYTGRVYIYIYMHIHTHCMEIYVGVYTGSRI